MERRELFKIVSAGAIVKSSEAQHKHAAPQPVDYKPRALSAKHYHALERLVDLLLPADAASHGAKDAGVAMYIDTVLTHGDSAMRNIWTSGLDAIGDASLETLAALAGKELAPATETERFFVIFKQAAINAYYLSDAGRKSLGYKGDIAIKEFPGCTHAEHQSG
jgi:hypothetical protein